MELRYSDKCAPEHIEEVQMIISTQSWNFKDVLKSIADSEQNQLGLFGIDNNNAYLLDFGIIGIDTEMIYVKSIKLI